MKDVIIVYSKYHIHKFTKLFIIPNVSTSSYNHQQFEIALFYIVSVFCKHLLCRNKLLLKFFVFLFLIICQRQ